MPAISAEVTYSLAERSALTDGNLIALLHTECRRNMSSQILVSLFIPGVFGNKVEVLASNYESSMHFRRHNGTSQNSPTD